MTTIVAIRDGKKIHFGADSQCTGGGTPFSVNKIHRIGKYTFGAAGVLSDIQATVRALEKDVKKSKKKPTIERFVKNVKGHGGTYIVALGKHLYEVGHDGSIVEMADKEPTGVGSGSAYALGALSVGAPLEQAVEVAASYDVYTGGQIVTVTV